MLSPYRKARAYRRLFDTENGPLAADAKIVLQDLAAHTGFYNITDRGASEVIQYNEGMRAAFWRIFRFLRYTHADMAKLAQDARERITDPEDDEE